MPKININKKYLPYIIAGAFVLIVIVILLLIPEKKEPENPYKGKKPEEIYNVVDALPFYSRNFSVDFNPDTNKFIVTIPADLPFEIQKKKAEEWFLRFPAISSLTQIDVTYQVGRSLLSEEARKAAEIGPGDEPENETVIKLPGFEGDELTDTIKE